MKNRSTVDLCAEILSAALAPSNKTKIMFRSNTTVRQLGPILERLLDKELLEYDEEKRTFLITKRGREFLDLYGSMVEGVRLRSAIET